MARSPVLSEIREVRQRRCGPTPYFLEGTARAEIDGGNGALPLCRYAFTDVTGLSACPGSATSTHAISAGCSGAAGSGGGGSLSARGCYALDWYGGPLSGPLLADE